jgi:anti-anti-sigma factor
MQPAKLELRSEPNSNDGSIVTKLDGKLSLETVHDFIETLRAEPAAHLVLDMSGVSFLDSAGVGALVSLFVSRKHHGKTFALAGLNQQGYAVIEVSGLLKLLPVFRSVEEAAAKPA